ncbi:MAG: PPOX class F420-dependent oxidoreductase [Actinomycetota bacterium]|jgi:PPOX class probable F420-dependent enzyme|nr:PPOX class F420-dependent oxidoreductase [Actinomycetota bacterium]
MKDDETPWAQPADLGRFVRQKTILLKTKKRDGTWVATPVSIVVEHDRAYVRTYDKSWKAKRLRNFPEVRFAPSTFRGKPTGQELHARARLLDGEEAQRAARLLARKYPVLHGVLVPFSHKVMRTKTLHYELSEVDS